LWPGKLRLFPKNEIELAVVKLYSIVRYEERDGGVYLELEAIALSRDIPAALRWMIEPIVRKVSRPSLVMSLEQTAEAVRSSTSFARRAPERVSPPLPTAE
jgi:hypothetical protein